MSKEQCSGDSAVPVPAANEADPTVVPAQAGIPDKCQPTRQSVAVTHPRPRQNGAARPAIRTKAPEPEPIENDKDEKPAPAELVPASRRIKQELDAHRHEPDPYGPPIDSTRPGRSPPR